MKTKALKYFRKHWEYRFTPNGGVMCRNKSSGQVMHFNKIVMLVHWYACSDKFGWATGMAYSKRKISINNKRAFDTLPVRN